MKKVPKVYFQFGNLRWDVEFISQAIKSKKFILNKFVHSTYPKIKDIGGKDREAKIKKYLIKVYQKNFNKITKAVISYQKIWDVKNDKYMRALSEVLEVKLPKNKTIDVCVGVNPVFPRDWKNWSFSIYFNVSKKMLIGTTAHEIVHMFYFKKLLETFPKINTKTFDYPYKEWKLSEIIAPIILNDPRIVKVIGKTELISYTCNEKTMLKFNKLYKQHLKEKTKFIDFYKKAKRMMG